MVGHAWVSNDVHCRWVATIHPGVPDEVGPYVCQLPVASPPTATLVALVATDCVMVLVSIQVYVVVPTVVYGRLLLLRAACSHLHLEQHLIRDRFQVAYGFLLVLRSTSLLQGTYQPS